MIDFSNNIVKEPMHIQRAPVAHHCECGKRNILIFPDTSGVLTWTCQCKRQLQITFRPAEDDKVTKIDLALQRTPLDHGCDCGRRDVIVLPNGRGELRWQCAGQNRDDNGVFTNCQKIWCMIFNETTGDVYSSKGT